MVDSTPKSNQNNVNQPGTGEKKSRTAAATDMARTATGAATNMGQTAARAAGDMTRTATGAATSMGQTAGEMGRTAAGAGMAAMAAAMPDMEQFLSAHRRNMEVLSQANRVALEGAQSVARRHMEMMQQTISEMTEAMRQMSNPESPQARTAKQAELVKAAYERAVTHIRELADLIQRSNGEALGLLNQRFTEASDEVRTRIMGSGTHGPDREF